MRALHLLALLAALSFALLPSLSRALATPTGAVAVCTAEGLRWLDVDTQQPVAPAHSAALDACGLCLLALEPAVPTADAPGWRIPVGAMGPLPGTSATAFRPAPGWRPDSARAPPALT